MKKSKFTLWFEEQFGKRPKGDLHRLINRKSDLQYEIDKISATIAAMDKWDNNLRAANYARQAADVNYEL